VTTQHDSIARTGANLDEVALTPRSVDAGESPGRFRLLFTRSVAGHVYAQPLYLPRLRMPDGRVHDVVFVATMHDDVYAFDADDPAASAPLWQRHLGEPLPDDFMNMAEGALGLNIRNEIGITSTPVIDPDAGRLYVSAKVCDTGHDCKGGSGRIVYRVAALDVRDGHVLAQQDIDPTSVVEHTLGGDLVPLDTRAQLQRTGLLLANGRVYLGFGAHQDTPPYHGWLVALDARTLALREHFCTSCQARGDGEIGIWQAGAGPAADQEGNVYVMTGNGPAEDQGGDYSSSFLRLSPDLHVTSTFSPANAACLDVQDVDLGSAGPLLVPGTDLLVGGGKEGVLYVLDRRDLGGPQAGGRAPWPGGFVAWDVPFFQRPCRAEGTEHPPLQSFQAASPWSTAFPGGTAFLDWVVTTMGYHHIHGSPVFWNEDGVGPMIYVWPERDRVRAFKLDVAQRRFLDTSPPGREPTATLTGPMSHKYGMPGAALSISANRGRDGILWATLPLEDSALVKTVRGVMRALDASTLRLLWDSRRDGDVDFYVAKYAPPTVANGKVYVPTFSGRLDVYGLVEP
jgi:outer membrane protein assembly factor BamB